MALWMRLMVNDTQIGHMQARRRTPGKPGPGDVCEYDWIVELNGDAIGNPTSDPLRHRFGDGAWALVAAILERAGHNPSGFDGETSG